MLAYLASKPKKSPLPKLVNPKKFTSPLQYHPKYTSVQQHNPKSQILFFIPNHCSFSLFGVSSQSSTLPLSTTIQSKLLSLITSLFSSQWWVFSGIGSGMGQVMVWVVGLVAYTGSWAQRRGGGSQRGRAWYGGLWQARSPQVGSRPHGVDSDEVGHRLMAEVSGF